jgi:hypothetical protein
MNGSRRRRSGRIMAPLLGCDEREDMAGCSACLQLTNFIATCARTGRLDRVYLPGLPEADRPRAAGDGAREAGSPAEVAAARRALFGPHRATCPSAARRSIAALGMRHARGPSTSGCSDPGRGRLAFDVLRGAPTSAPWEAGRARRGRRLRA